MAVVIADVGGSSTRPLAQGLARRLRRAGVVVVTCGRASSGPESNPPVSGAIRRLLDSGGGRPILVLFGNEARQRRLVWGLTLAGLLPRVRLVVHAGAARVPYEPSLVDVFARADVCVTESELGAKAVRQCCAEAGEPAPQVVVLHPALPPGASLREPTAADRRARRQASMGVADDAVVVGCWTGDGPEEVAPLALRIFQLFARGHYLRCDCGHVTPWSEDDHLRLVPSDHCARCGSASAVVGRARDDARLVLIGEALTSEDGLWRAGTIGRHLGLEDRVVHEPTPTSPHDLGQLWGCVDVHVQPHVLADVPPSMGVSCVLGVPIVATGHGAVEEQLSGAANLVPPRMVMDHSDGHRLALMDPGSALVELCHLADDRAARRLASARLRELARRWGASTRLDRWVELLDVRIAS